MVGGNDIMISIILFDVLLVLLLLFDVLLLDIVLIGIGSMVEMILSLLDGVLIFVFSLSLLCVLLMFRMI